MKCWHCGEKYDIHIEKCPKCGFQNKNSKNPKALAKAKVIIFSSILSIGIVFTIACIMIATKMSKPITPEEFKNKMEQKGYSVYSLKGSKSLETVQGLSFQEATDFDTAIDTEKGIVIFYVTGDKEYIKSISNELKKRYDQSEKEKEIYSSMVETIDNTLVFSSIKDSETYNIVREEFKYLGYSIDLGALFYILFAYGILSIAILSVISWMTIFEKTGKNGWYYWIPIYREYYTCQIAFNNGILCILLFIPYVNILFNLYTNYCIAKKFGKSKAFCISFAVLELWLLPFIAYDSTYQEQIPETPSIEPTTI